jgi:hypothetical protein
VACLFGRVSRWTVFRTKQGGCDENVKTLMITDLDGNHIAFAEAFDKGMAR